MVTITNVIERESDKGSFVLLELSGDVEMVQSQNTLRFYATVRKCTVSTTLDLQAAKACIGKQLPGTIVRVQSEPYEYTNESTGEVMLLSHRLGLCT
jgi:hypothetical protein